MAFCPQTLSLKSVLLLPQFSSFPWSQILALNNPGLNGPQRTAKKKKKSDYKRRGEKEEEEEEIFFSGLQSLNPTSNGSKINTFMYWFGGFQSPQ